MAMCLLFSNCAITEVDGIKIGHNLYDTQGYKENQALVRLIKQTLKRDEASFAQLIGYWCGGAAGCYDLGGVITQIIYKIGEDDFIHMTNHLSSDQKKALKGLIDVGLEYGDNRLYSTAGSTTIDVAFPKLALLLGN